MAEEASPRPAAAASSPGAVVAAGRPADLAAVIAPRAPPPGDRDTGTDTDKAGMAERAHTVGTADLQRTAETEDTADMELTLGDPFYDLGRSDAFDFS